MALPEPLAVLYGGPSAEAEVSKVTAEGMSAALTNLGLDHVMVEFKQDWLEKIRKNECKFILIAMHGCPGEDGTIQGALELEGLPYNGSGVMASSVAIDKSMAKRLFVSAGMDVAQERIFEATEFPSEFADVGLNLPFVIKPLSGGSSVGVHIVETEAHWKTVLPDVKKCLEPMMVESYIPGRELTVAVMGNKALSVIEIMTDGHEFYNYSSKYESGGSQHICPAAIPADVAAQVQSFGLKAHRILGCNGVTRTDFRYDEEAGRLVVLELNTLPGMTPVSLVPEMAEYQGINYDQLVQWMIEDGLCQDVK